MIFRFITRLVGVVAVLTATTLFAVDLEPITKVKISNQAESSVVDIRSDLDSYKRLTVDAFVSNTLPITLVPSSSNILRQNEVAVATKVETDLTSSTYTVPTGKAFRLTTFHGSYDTQSPMYVRFKKQTACTGSFVTQLRITLKQHGQDESNFEISFPLGLIIGAAGDCFKVTYESHLSKGTLWAGYTGVEL